MNECILQWRRGFLARDVDCQTHPGANPNRNGTALQPQYLKESCKRMDTFYENPAQHVG